MMKVCKLGCATLWLLLPGVSSAQVRLFPLTEYAQEAGGDADISYVSQRCAGLFGALLDFGQGGFDQDNTNFLTRGLEKFTELAFVARSEGMTEVEMQAISEELSVEINSFVDVYAQSIERNVAQFSSLLPEGEDFTGDVSFCTQALQFM